MFLLSAKPELLLVLLLLLATSSSGTISTPVNAALKPEAPHQDSFYSRPHHLEHYKPGDVIRTRKVTTSLLPLTAHIFPREGTQLVYRTTNFSGDPSWSVTTILKPLQPKNPPQILSVQMEEDSINIDCSPSYLTAVGPQWHNNWMMATLSDVYYIEHALKKGWYVVAPDYEGPTSLFGVGPTAAHAALDSLRAARHYMKFPHNTDMVLTGYSGGAHATVWMANLAGTYAPELNIIGAAHGGTPVDLTAVLHAITKTFFAAFVTEAVISLAKGHPEAEQALHDYASAQAKKNMAQVTARPSNCMISALTHEIDQDVLHEVKPPYKTINGEPRVQAAVNSQSLLVPVTSSPVYTPKFPRLIYHAKEDEVTPRGVVEQYIRERCDDGDHIEYEITSKYDHMIALWESIPGVLRYLEKVFAHEIPKVKCGTSSPSYNVNLDSPEAEETLGKDMAERIRARKKMTEALMHSVKLLNGSSEPSSTRFLFDRFINEVKQIDRLKL